MPNMTKLEKAKKVMTGASTGIAVAVAFLNVALLVAELVKTVSADESLMQADELEE